jgi:hypothetical protein
LNDLAVEVAADPMNFDDNSDPISNWSGSCRQILEVS